MQQPSELFTSLTLLRNSPGRYVAGRWVDGAWTSVTIAAHIQPGGPREAMNLPEGERNKDTISLYTKDPVFVVDEVAGTKADRVLHAGVYWRVHKVETFDGPPDIAHSEALCVKEQAS